MSRKEVIASLIIYKTEKEIVWLKIERAGDVFISSESVGGDRIIKFSLEDRALLFDILLNDRKESHKSSINLGRVLLDYFERHFGGKAVNPFDKIKGLLDENEVSYLYSYWPNR